MEIVEDRYAGGANLVTSQLPVEAWHDIVDAPPSWTLSWIVSSTTLIT